MGLALRGHHLSLSLPWWRAIASITPSFWGTNPGKVLDGPRKGLQVLVREENSARTLAQSLSKKQSAGIFADKAPADIITKADRKAKRLEPLGISAAKMKKNR